MTFNKIKHNSQIKWPKPVVGRLYAPRNTPPLLCSRVQKQLCSTNDAWAWLDATSTWFALHKHRSNCDLSPTEALNPWWARDWVEGERGRGESSHQAAARDVCAAWCIGELFRCSPGTRERSSKLHGSRGNHSYLITRSRKSLDRYNWTCGWTDRVSLQKRGQSIRPTKHNGHSQRLDFLSNYSTLQSLLTSKSTIPLSYSNPQFYPHIPNPIPLQHSKSPFHPHNISPYSTLIIQAPILNSSPYSTLTFKFPNSLLNPKPQFYPHIPSLYSTPTSKPLFHSHILNPIFLTPRPC